MVRFGVVFLLTFTLLLLSCAPTATEDEEKEGNVAIEIFTEAIRLNPEDALAYYNRGIVYMELNEESKATADFEKAISITNDPDLTQMAGQMIEEMKE